jgi:hypothetical protein
MVTTEITIRRRSRVPLAVRGAQALFLVPLGLLQLVAAIVFGVTDDLHGGDYAVGAWAVAMAAAGVVVALRLGRGDARTRRLAFALLAAQTAFALVKLGVYHESASFVFLGIIAAAATLLSRRARYLSHGFFGS